MDDPNGTAVTRHNLEVLSSRPPRRARALRGPWLALLGAVLGAVGGVAVVLAVGSGGGADRPAAPRPTATVTDGQPAGRATIRTTSSRPRAERAAPRPRATGGTPAKPDLVVLRARAVSAGGSCVVRWTVRNRGRAKASPGTTALSWGLAGGGSGTSFERLPALPAGAQRQQEKSSGGYGCGAFASLTVRADPNDRVNESNEANNRRAARLG